MAQAEQGSFFLREVGSVGGASAMSLLRVWGVPQEFRPLTLIFGSDERLLHLLWSSGSDWTASRRRKRRWLKPDANAILKYRFRGGEQQR